MRQCDLPRKGSVCVTRFQTAQNNLNAQAVLTNSQDIALQEMLPTSHFSTALLLLLWAFLGTCSCMAQLSGDIECEIPCERERFDIGKDCVDSGARCPCIAHCCWAFDCRMWPIFAQCRKKCRVAEWNHFGTSKGSVKCDHFRCHSNYLMAWDLREVSDKTQITCIQHCCYAFNCKKYSGYCREMCAH